MRGAASPHSGKRPLGGEAADVAGSRMRPPDFVMSPEEESARREAGKDAKRITG